MEPTEENAEWRDGVRILISSFEHVDPTVPPNEDPMDVS